MGWIAIPIGIGVGTGVTKKFGGGSWGESLGYATATTLMAAAIRNPMAMTRGSVNLARFLFPVVRAPVAFIFQDLLWPAVRPLGVGVLRSAAAIVSSQTVIYTAGISAGYVIGAIIGTKVAEEVWGEKGKQEAIGFYTGGKAPGSTPPNYWGTWDDPGYFNLPGNYWKIITEGYRIGKKNVSELLEPPEQ